MKFLTQSCKLALLLTFSISAVFASEDEMMIFPSTEKDTENTEKLEEEVIPPPPAALIDLDHKNKKIKKTPKYGTLALFVFNIAMFTAGMAMVKAITGKKV